MLFAWSPREVLALVEGLPDDGVYAAYLTGGEKWREFYGWGKGRHMIADQWDAAVALAYGAAGSKKKPPTYDRPGVKKKKQGVPFMQAFGLSKGD